MNEEVTESKLNRRWLKVTAITLSVLIIVAGLSVGGYFLFSSRQLDPAPDFSITTLNDQNFTLSSYRGKVVLLDFMSITCAPCWEMVPELISYTEEFQDDLVILSIDVDFSDNASDLKTKADEYNATWEFAIDYNSTVQGLFSVTGLPKIVVINIDGFITFSKSGVNAHNDLYETVQETIEGTASIISFRHTFYLVAAFIAGALSFFSPCAFPLLPGYMAYNLDLLAKEEKEDEEVEEDVNEQEIKKIRVRKRLWKSFLWGSSAAFGVALFYMIIGLIAAFVGEVVGEWVEYITPAIGGILIILGIISLTPYSIDMSRAINAIEKLFSREKNNSEVEDENQKKEKKKNRFRREIPNLVRLFVYGITYALASIGCNLPILLGLVGGAIESGDFLRAILIFIVYSFTMALLMIGITILVGLSKDTLINKLQASTKVVKILSGVLLILAGGFLIGYFLWNRYKI